MEQINKLKSQKSISRGDIEELLASIGGPGENRQEKIGAVKQLNKANFQGIRLEQTLESYRNF
jgi:hypothetical protein